MAGADRTYLTGPIWLVASGRTYLAGRFGICGGVNTPTFAVSALAELWSRPRRQRQATWLDHVPSVLDVERRRRAQRRWMLARRVPIARARPTEQPHAVEADRLRASLRC